MLLSLRVAMLRDSDEHTAAEVMLRGWAIKGPAASPLCFLLITQLPCCEDTQAAPWGGPSGEQLRPLSIMSPNFQGMLVNSGIRSPIPTQALMRRLPWPTCGCDLMKCVEAESPF